MDFTAEELEEIKKLIDEVMNQEEIVQICDQIAFKGFNPLQIFRKIKEMMAADSSVKSAVFVMIIFGLTRGFGGNKSWEMILQKTNPEGRTKLDEARNKLEVKLTRPDNDETVTVPRLMQVFCFWTFQIYCLLIQAGKVRAMEYKGDLPQKLRWIGSPACMNEKAWNRWKDDYASFSVQCSEVWNRKQSLETAKRFAELAYNTVTWPKDFRKGIRDLRIPLVSSPDSEGESDEEIPKQKKEVPSASAETVVISAFKADGSKKPDAEIQAEIDEATKAGKKHVLKETP